MIKTSEGIFAIEAKGPYRIGRANDWLHFSEIVQSVLSNSEHQIFRGQRQDNWQLTSTFSRLADDLDLDIEQHYLLRSKLFEEFKYAARGRRGPSPAELDDKGWWALGQHHGLATPLLDWTVSPFVAAYFAFMEEDGPEQTEYRSVFVLNKTKVQETVENFFTEETRHRLNLRAKIEAGEDVGDLAPFFASRPVEKDLEIFRPLSDENHRLINQGGLFTYLSLWDSIEDWIQHRFKPNTRDYDELNILVRIDIPNSERETCLKALNQMNINHLTLFPDLDGASKYCNINASIRDYS